MKKQYLIDMPPPTISGKLHMGHLFSYSQMDFIARYHQMKGKELVYPFAYDNNGVPTEKYAHDNGINKTDEIINLSNKTSSIYRKLFDDIEMGFSDHSYNTFNKISQEVTELSFLDLKSKGLVYKAAESISFCTKCNRSIPLSEIKDNLHEADGGTIETREIQGWFINLLDHKEALKQQVELIDWKPIKFKKRLLNWIDGIDRDWSIARQRDYGISIPGEDSLKFDTWFISSLTPQITWSTHIGEAMLDCPVFDLRFQAHDIITTWALYTIVKSYFHNGQIPWKQIVISGHAVTEGGDKLSKSKGNFLTPYYYIDQYGSEGVRHWAAQNAIGTDTLIDDDIMKVAFKLPIKLKNALKFIKFQHKKGWFGSKQVRLDHWQVVKSHIDGYFESSEFSRAFHYLYDFFWKTFCGQWIEECKKDCFSDTLKIIFEEMIPYFRIYFPSISYE